MKQKHKHSPAGNKVAPTSLEITWRNVANTNGAFPFLRKKIKVTVLSGVMVKCKRVGSQNFE